MRTIRRSAAFALVALSCFTLAVHADEPPKPPPPMAQILVLGTFHFKDAGRDTYKPQYDVDIMSPERQAEVAQMIECLSKYHPTKVAIEVDFDRDEEFNERYRSYLDGKFELKANEVYQLGFRLARANNLTRIFSVDADRRFYQPEVDPYEYAKEHGQDSALTVSETPYDDFYMSLYAYEDELKAHQPLQQTFLQMNNEDRLILGHGHYLIGSFKAGEGNEYPGADAATSWYNRNLRILANLTRITEPGDRLLLIIGSGHVPILRHAIQASPEYDLVEVRDYLGDACGE